MLLGDVNWMLEAEGEQRFRGQNDLFVACESGSCCARAAASKCANGRALTTACKCADESAEACAAPDESGRAFALAPLSVLNGAGGDRVAAPFRMYALQPNRKESSTFETAEGFGVDDGAFSASAAGDNSLSIDIHVVGDGSTEGVTGLGNLRSEVLVEADAEVRAGGEFYHSRRRRRLRGSGAGLREVGAGLGRGLA